MATYSMDLRERVVRAVDTGEGTQEQIAKRFFVSSRWIRSLLSRRAATGSVAPKPHAGGRKRLIQREAAESLRAAVLAAPDATLEELRETIGFGGCLMTVWRAIERLKLPRKKSPCGPKSRSTRRSSRGGRSGSNGRRTLTRVGSSSSMRVMPRRP
jgi:transposase